MLNRFRGMTAVQMTLLAVLLIAAIAFLVFGGILLFYGGRIQKVLSAREVLDGLAISAMAAASALYLFLRPQQARSTAPRRGRFSWRFALPLCALILIAAGLRFHLLDYQSLWRDEIASVARVQTSSLSEALALGNWQDAWPSYHIPLYAFVRLAGDSEFAFRFPSTLAGILLIPVLFVLGRRMFGVREGLIAAGLAVALRTPLWYSQEMRAYAFLTLYAALAAYFWVRLAEDMVWRGRASRFALVGFLVSAILTIYAHYYGLVLIAVEGLGALILMIHLRRLSLPLVALFAGIGLSYLPWIPLMLFDLGKGAFWPDKPTWLGGQFFGYLIFAYGSWLVWGAVVLAAIGIAATLWRSFRRGDGGKALPLVVTPGVILLAWLLLPYAVAYWRSVVATPILVNRYLLVSLPAAYLLLARAVTRLPLGKPLQSLAGAALVIVVIGHLLFSPYYVRLNKTDLRAAVGYITSHESDASSQVIIAGFQGGKSELDYYFRKSGSDSTIDIKAGNTWQIDDVRARLAERNPRLIWFIGQHLFYEKEFEEFLAAEYTPVSQQKFYSVTVYLYENASGN